MPDQTPPLRNSTGRVLLASLAGTTIEFFDFYIYGTAAVLVFPRLFFPASNPGAAVLQSLATFALAFLARPIGSALFGHFGDRIGRKATLVAALMTMGLATLTIGLVPTYATIGIAAPTILAICRFAQGLGLGGEWGGAVLLATENAPPGRRAWFGMFPQLGAPIGFVASSGLFLLMSQNLSEADFLAWGWRIPFLASALLVVIGLYVRLKITEAPEFLTALSREKLVRLPLATVVSQHGFKLLVGTFAGIMTFVIFYVMTVFSLGWGTAQLDIPRADLLEMQIVGMAGMAAGIVLSAWWAERIGCRRMLLTSALLIAAFGFLYAPLFSSGADSRVLVVLVCGLFLVGLSYGPLGTAMAELFPTNVRYTGASLAFNLAGILGASVAPYVATWFATQYGLRAVGYYVTASGLISLIALLGFKREAPTA
jgi:metabolite-proton symporter